MAVSLSGMSLYTDNDNEAGWNATTDGPDTYNESIQGNNSESWQIRKNENLTALLTSSATMPTTRGIFIVWLKSDVSKFYNNVDIVLRSSTNNEKSFPIADSTTKYNDGLWRPFALDYVNKGTETGTYAPASHTVMGWHIAAQNVNFRAIINNWCDACYYGTGHTVSGTTTTDKLFAEATAVDELTANKYGVLQNIDGIIFAQADLNLAGTNLISDSETLVFKDTPNGYSTYWLDITGTAVFLNTSVIAAGAIDYDMDTTSATSFSMYGGTLNGYGQLTMASGNIMDGVVLQAGTNAVLGNTLDACTFNQCGPVSLTSGSLVECIFNEPVLTANTAAVVASNLSTTINNCTFTRGTNGYAVELTGTPGSYDWNSKDPTNSYATGSTGTGVQRTGVAITGDEHIWINDSNTGNTYSITVAAGAVVPSVATAGAIVNVTANQVTLTLSNIVQNSEVRIFDTQGTSAEGDDVELAGVENIGGTADPGDNGLSISGPDGNGRYSASYSYTYSAGTFVNIIILNEDYEYYRIGDLELSAGGGSIPVSQQTDRNFIPPTP